MTTVTNPTSAAQRRAILANAHAAYMATRKNPKVDAVHNLKQALMQTGNAQITDWVKDVRLEGTTIVAVIDMATSVEVIELDAYGNTMKGTL